MFNASKLNDQETKIGGLSNKFMEMYSMVKKIMHRLQILFAQKSINTLIPFAMNFLKFLHRAV